MNVAQRGEVTVKPIGETAPNGPTSLDCADQTITRSTGNIGPYIYGVRGGHECESDSGDQVSDTAKTKTTETAPDVSHI